MNKNFETELPAGYREAFVVDANQKKLGIILNAAAAVVSVLGIAISIFIYHPSLSDFTILHSLVFIAVMIGYIVLHELTHGAAYKLLTGRKLTFGFSFSVAFCGVPDIFVYRKTALISLLAPFTVFNIVFLLGAILLPTSMDRFLSAVMLAIHVGGCSGDLYDTYLFLTKFRDPATLMQDTGPKQTVYTK